MLSLGARTILTPFFAAIVSPTLSCSGIYRIGCDEYSNAGIKYCMDVYIVFCGRLASVSGHCMMLYVVIRTTRAILISIRANLVPIQHRGPVPKGIYAQECLFDFSLSLNLFGNYIY